MSCYYPRLAVRFGHKTNGSQNIKFLPNRVDFSINDYRSKFGEDLLLLPCGKCLGCKVDKARDWSIRAVLESQYYERNSFITLTYDDKFLPLDSKSCKKDVDSFLEQLKYRGFNFRHFGCIEYGSKTHRIHSHIILFGFMPDDLKVYSKGIDGNFLFTSEYLSSVWDKGHVIIGFCSQQSAGYVARYTTKKLGDDDSMVFMSTHPGLGFRYLQEHAFQIVTEDKVYGEFPGGCAPVPRYFNRFLSLWFPMEYKKLQQKRLDNVRVSDINSMIQLKTTLLENLKTNQAKVLDRKLSRLERN